MEDDIVERLLNRAANAVIIKEKPNLYYDAAHEIERLRAENEKLHLEMDMQQATILVPSKKDDQRRIERLDAELKEALDEAATVRAENEKLREVLIGLCKPVFENPVEVGSALDLALSAAFEAIGETDE